MAVTQGNDALYSVDERQFMGGNDQGCALGGGLIEKGEECFLAGGIKANEGLVNEEKLEGPDECDCDGGLLSKTSREALG